MNGVVYRNEESTTVTDPTIHLATPDSDDRRVYCGTLNGMHIKEHAYFEYIEVPADEEDEYNICGNCKRYAPELEE